MKIVKFMSSQAECCNYEENGLGMLFYTHTPTKWSADRVVDRYYATHGR